MADEWYYWRDTEVLGPFSGRLFAGLVSAGVLLPTDTVWKGDVEEGVPAASIRNLFPSGPTKAAPPDTIAGESDAGNGGAIDKTGQTATSSPADAREVPAPWFCGPSATKVTSKARAVAGKGALIVGQDGTTVKYRKKCTVCGHEDSSWKTAAITRGTTRVTFFCPKCRKSCAVEIHGHLS